MHIVFTNQWDKCSKKKMSRNLRYLHGFSSNMRDNSGMCLYSKVTRCVLPHYEFRSRPRLLSRSPGLLCVCACVFLRWTWTGLSNEMVWRCNIPSFRQSLFSSWTGMFSYVYEDAWKNLYSACVWSFRLINVDWTLPLSLHILAATVDAPAGQCRLPSLPTGFWRLISRAMSAWMPLMN